MTALEERLRVALLAGAAQVEESPDLFARVKGSIEDETKRRAWRRQVGAVAGVAVAGLLGLIASVTDYQEGELLMTWWILELLTTAVLVTVVIVLGPFIKRFGRSYAAEVFRSNPSTGKSFLVLMDFAYYLIFGAYILFTLVFDTEERDLLLKIVGQVVRPVVVTQPQPTGHAVADAPEAFADALADRLQGLDLTIGRRSLAPHSSSSSWARSGASS